jgi:hypothetical protein
MRIPCTVFTDEDCTALTTSVPGGRIGAAGDPIRGNRSFQ